MLGFIRCKRSCNMRSSKVASQFLRTAAALVNGGGDGGIGRARAFKALVSTAASGAQSACGTVQPVFCIVS